MTPSRRLLALAVVVGIATPGCGGRARPTGRAGNGTVRFVVPVRDVDVWLDDRYLGAADAYPAGISIRAGHHQLVFRHDAYLPRYLEVDVAAGATVELPVDLALRLPE